MEIIFFSISSMSKPSKTLSSFSIVSFLFLESGVADLPVIFLGHEGGRNPSNFSDFLLEMRASTSEKAKKGPDRVALETIKKNVSSKTNQSSFYLVNQEE